MRKIFTLEMAKENFCDEACKIFKRHYPKGLVITKKNLKEVANKMAKTRSKLKIFSSLYMKHYCYGSLLNEILYNLKSSVYSDEFYSKLVWSTTPMQEQLDYFWELWKS